MTETTDKLGFHKIKNFSSGKDNVKRMRRYATDIEEIFAKTHLIKTGNLKIHKELSKLNQNNTNDLIKGWAKDVNRPSQKIYGWQVNI